MVSFLSGGAELVLPPGMELERRGSDPLRLHLLHFRIANYLALPSSRILYVFEMEG